MHLSISILQIALFTEQALGCIPEPDLLRTEIDWSKMGGTWYGMVDIPENSGPLCWTFEKFRPIKNGVRITSYENEYWHQENSQPTQIEFVHNDKGLYSERSINVTKFNEEVESSLINRGRKETLKIVEKEDRLQLQHNSFFLTDYEKYFIVVFCLYPGLRAFAMSPTPSINIELLNHITVVLNKIGLKSPTMTLNTGCMKTGFGQNGPK